MISDLYGEQILEAAANLPGFERLENPDAHSHKMSRVCGSELFLDLNFDNNKVSAVGLKVQACALGQAAASIIVQNLIGANALELFALHDQMVAMLKQGKQAPSHERWSDIAALAPIHDYPQRHASTLLMVKAIEECLVQMGFTRQAPLTT